MEMERIYILNCLRLVENNIFKTLFFLFFILNSNLEQNSFTCGRGSPCTLWGFGVGSARSQGRSRKIDRGMLGTSVCLPFSSLCYLLLCNPSLPQLFTYRQKDRCHNHFNLWKPTKRVPSQYVGFPLVLYLQDFF